MNNNNFITIHPENLKLTMMQTILKTQKGTKHLTLQIDQKTTTKPLSKTTSNLSTFLYNLTLKTDTIVTLQNIPQCIFQRNLLKPPIKETFENRILSQEIFSRENTLLKTCQNCMAKSTCKGIDKNYLKKFGHEEFTPLISNKDSSQLNKNKISQFKSSELKQLCTPILKDYENDKHYLRKRIVFSNSYPSTLEESSKERIIYYIFNRQDDFTPSIKLIENYFNPQTIKLIKNYLKKTNQLVISLAQMSDNNIRKTFYFNTNNLKKEEFAELLKTLQLQTNKQEIPWGIGIDIKENKTSYKIYYTKKTIYKSELLNYAKEFQNKEKFEKFCNSLTAPLKHCLFDIKIKNNKAYSKRIDISMQFNQLPPKQTLKILNINPNEYSNLKLYTLSFEFTKDKPEKINIYYSLK